MNKNKAFFAVTVVLGFLAESEGLECYECSYGTINGKPYVDGDASCANGKTPDSSLLKTCTALPGEHPVCSHIFLKFQSPEGKKETYVQTRRFCGTQPELNLGCHKTKPGFDSDGTVTTCWCDEDKCNASGSGNVHSVYNNDLLLVLFMGAFKLYLMQNM